MPKTLVIALLAESNRSGLMNDNVARDTAISPTDTARIVTVFVASPANFEAIINPANKSSSFAIAEIA